MNCIEQDSLSQRRSFYGLDKLSVKALDCVQDTIASCILNCPTPFNVQSARVVLLLNEQHNLFWNLVWQQMEKVIKPEQKEASQARISAFKQAHGTILYFEDKEALEKLKQQYPLYAKNINIWAQQANGILQYMIWSSLAENNIGASLQHYNELVADALHKTFNLPTNWEIVAQMPFGSITKEPSVKTFLSLKERFIIKK